MRRRQARAVQALHASMGPRSCERGNADATLIRSASVFCFNGAALVRARKSGRLQTRLPGHRRRFNGAALVRARKYEAVAETPRYLRGFNGAALVRARKYYDCGKNWQKLGELQWGRARASAEIKFPRMRICKQPLLQWGRARASAEMT